MYKKLLLAAFLLASTSVNASIIKITGTSAAAGELGWFAVDEAVLAADADKRLFASEFFDFFFEDPTGSGTIFDPSTVTSDTGTTIFGMLGGVWTVTGGAGDSLTHDTLDAHVWIAGTTFAIVGETFGPGYDDVSWTTRAYVPAPATIALFGLGLIAVGFARRRNNV